MPTFRFAFYALSPEAAGFPAGTGQFTYSGPGERTGIGQITDHGSGADGLTFVDNDGVTGTFTVNGKASTDVPTEPDGGYLLRDLVTGQEFRATGLHVTSGPAAGMYLISEKPLVPGRQYVVLSYEDDPSVTGTGASYAGIVCFARGMRVDTPDGPRPVETLRPGDLVATLDAGPQPVVWSRLNRQRFGAGREDELPVLIRAGALGPGRPALDLIVSPQHRVLAGGYGQLEGAFDSPCLVPAKALTGLPRVRRMRGKQAIDWVHFAFDRHHVVWCHGALSESLFLGPMAVRGLAPTDIAVLNGLFGRVLRNGALNGPPARRLLSVGDARRLLQRQSDTSGIPEAACGLAAGSVKRRA